MDTKLEMEVVLQFSQDGREHVWDVDVELVAAKVAAGKHATPAR